MRERTLRNFVHFSACIATWCVLLFAERLALSQDQQQLNLRDGAAVKKILDVKKAGVSLLKTDGWRPWGMGFDKDGNWFVCDNSAEGKVQRGVSQTIILNQSRPEPIVAVAWSKALNVGGAPDSDYSLYLDLVYTDGTPLWGQVHSFGVGTHDWQRREVTILPEKPVKTLSFHMLLRNHSGKAWFRDPELRVVSVPEGAFLFDGVPVIAEQQPEEGLQVRDVAVQSGFVRIEREALGLKLESKMERREGTVLYDVVLTDTTGKDRAVTLYYCIRSAGGSSTKWFQDPRLAVEAVPGREYSYTTRFRAGSNGRLSKYPLGAISASPAGMGKDAEGTAMGIDLRFPAFYRIGYNAGSGEIFLAYDIGLTAEKPSARIKFCRFQFPAKDGFRAALSRYYKIYPEAFVCRTPEQGLWMPFAKISAVENWQDFGFKFKEGDNETAWDDAHGITTFRYTEPMTWWMTMPQDSPHTLESALGEAKRLADKGDTRAKALFTSGYHDGEGQFPARILDTPWCDGAVWSMNSMPGIAGDVTDFKNKWNPQLADKLYGPACKAELDGEYVDSAEGYVTDELDFRRDHFAAADTPLVFAPDTYAPAIFRGLIAFEYVRGITRDIHARGKLMMANGAPDRLPWLIPMLEVSGTETDWNHNGKWRPMSDADMLYRRAMCKGKPYCFLMNTDFEKFDGVLVEKYMKRSLAYGMFPGFFSHNASEGHYFTRPQLYNRDRPLFMKYVPLCGKLARAGWEPVTMAHSSDDKIYVERFGDLQKRYD
ncbi:hypothetical protein KJ878_06620 [Patescibacteria group bacterium]|nr:hypothetical protein [Patescibacteria group bacterium]